MRNFSDGPCLPVALGELGDGEKNNIGDTPVVKTVILEIHIYKCKSPYIFLFILLSPLLLAFIPSPRFTENKPMAKTSLIGEEVFVICFRNKGTLVEKTLLVSPLWFDFISLFCRLMSR